ncbi:sensor histidine kinase [Pedobacter endophyticus]|uniref:histidine kinase n=1 Tax=Pedobacter endophyticus TaxID=2789740 RepID=A0A7S9Q0K5_9SPHI|nr:ATP-binding protein [Pedobacter endophyticus]QPH40881.1 HAMP domain-containing protein [Pedobacter endophyticus]
MKLKTKYILFIVILHLICLVMSYYIFEKNKVIFMIAEVFIIISVVISISLYRQLISPLTYLKQGIAAIKDRDFNVKFLSTGKKEVDELVDVYNRMIDELRTERTKQEEQHFFLEKLVQTSPTGIIILDYDGQVKQINPKATEILNTNPNLLDTQIKDIKTGTSKMLRVDGLHTYKIQKSRFIDRGFERVFIMLEEVTAEIFAAEKNVYGKVIRMMAHEVNNTIGPVNSIINTALAQKNVWLTDDDQIENAMKIAVERNQNLNIFMRNFANLVKLPDVNIKKIDLASLIRSVAKLMHFAALEKQVTFKLDLPSEPYFIAADMEQMEQALINVIKNAIEAIDGDGKIILSIDTTNRALLIIDNGKGISNEHAAELFSPFFSTKKDGQGIGLTLVREILLNHGFEFSLKTWPPGVTTFQIKL